MSGKWGKQKFLKNFFVIVLVTACPIALYAFTGNPVELLKVSGAIEAAHIPIVTGLVLYLNWKRLPQELQPSKITFIICILAGLFFAVFAGLFILQVTGLIDLGGT